MKKTMLFLLLAFCLSNSVQAGQDAVSIKLISFNMRTSWGRDGDNSWPNRRHATAQMLRQEAPDVMGVQEAMQDQFELLDSGTFWISETPDNVSRGWDAACNRTVTWVELRDKSSGKEFFYFNTHLDHQGKIAREEGVKLIVTKIRQIAGKKAAVILGGDLNTSIDNPHLKPLTRLMASARDTAAETDQKGTFNGFGSAPDTIILDHLFYRGRMKCRKFVTLDGDYGAPYISDHYPIAMVFTL